jgi:hypothetical protein
MFQVLSNNTQAATGYLGLRSFRGENQTYIEKRGND